MQLGLDVDHAGDGLEVVYRGLARGVALKHGAPEVGHPVAGRAQADEPDQPLDAGLLVVGEPLVRLQLDAAIAAGLTPVAGAAVDHAAQPVPVGRVDSGPHVPEP